MSAIIGMIIMMVVNFSIPIFAQNRKQEEAVEAVAGRYLIGLKYHVPVKKNGKWQFLAHEVQDNTKSDLVDNDKTKWQLVTARTRKIAMKIKKSNKPILVDFALVDNNYRKTDTEVEGKTWYLIYNWEPAGDDVTKKIK